MDQEVKSINAAVQFIHLSQKKTGIQPKHVCWRSSYRSIGRVLKINPQSVANWVKQYTSNLPPAPMPSKVRKAELDELYTFIGEKKTKSISSR